MRGGYADYQTAFDTLPADLQTTAEVGALNKAFGDLTQFIPARPTGQAGGAKKGKKAKKSRKSRKLRGGMAPLEAPSMLLRPEDEPAAFLNPQWYNENIVNPNFQAPSSPYLEATKGGARKSRKSRKAGKKAKKSRKGTKKGRKSRKSRKNMMGGKRRRSSSKAKKSRKNRKH